uniref:Multiple C2 domain-containing protein n=1 Tax=Panagrolaimus sp. JU765 TaxID=591449 RepID=A0AC34PVJ1_9BILA
MFFITFVYFIQLHHWPILLLLLFVRFHIYHKVSESIEIRFRTPPEDESIEEDDDEVPNEQTKKPNLKKSASVPPANQQQKITEKSSGFIDRFQAVQDILQVIQLQLDYIASLLERFRNTFNFTVPYLSYLAIFVLIVAAIVLYYVPFRWLIMIWGINKFSKRLRNPHYVDNNELLDFLSRVPSDKELKMYRESRANCEEPSPPPRNVPIQTSPKTKVNNKKTKLL